jgi:adenosylhomocysteine nucleosidase
MAKDYIITVALEKELPFLKNESIIYTGIGKINATYKLTKYLVENPQIKKVFNFGTAGAVAKLSTKIIKCSRFIQGDIDCSTVGFEPTVTPYEHGTKLISFGKGAICSTQDVFVTSKPTHECDVVDMESYALAKVCKLFNKQFICYKFISDKVGSQNQAEEWDKNQSFGANIFQNILHKELQQ